MRYRRSSDSPAGGGGKARDGGTGVEAGGGAGEECGGRVGFAFVDLELFADFDRATSVRSEARSSFDCESIDVSLLHRFKSEVGAAFVWE